MSKAKLTFSTLQPCELHIGKYRIVGELFVETKHHYVLINDVRSGIDLGPLKSIKEKHIDPECSVSVFQKAIVDRITKLRVQR